MGPPETKKRMKKTGSCRQTTPLPHTQKKEEMHTGGSRHAQREQTAKQKKKRQADR
jgi:hypothetical protein